MIHTLIRLLNTVYRGMFYMKNRIANKYTETSGNAANATPNAIAKTARPID